MYSESLSSKSSEMLHPLSMKRKRLHSTQNTMTPPISTSTFQMIRKYNASNEYEFAGDWYVQIQTPQDMFPDMYLFGSIGQNDPNILGIIINCYSHGESGIVFQVEVIKETEVKLVSCRVEYTKFRPDLIEASSKDLPNTIKDSMFKLDSYESFNKSGLKSCTDLLERIAAVLKYRNVRNMKTSSVLLYLHKRGKLFDKIPVDKLDACLYALRKRYLEDLEESIAGSDFTPTIEFQKTRKVESDTVKLANKVSFKTPFIDCLRSARQFLIANDKLKKRKIGNSKTAEDKVDDETLCSFFDCAISNLPDKKILLYLDQAIWDKWDTVFNCYQLGTLKCSPSQLEVDIDKYKINSLHNLTAASLRPLQGLSIEDIASVADKILDGTVWFSIPLNHPTNAITLKDYCSKLKTNRTILNAMVEYCQSHDQKLNNKTLTTSNILEHYEINDIIFANFCKAVAGSTYVKGSRNTKIESFSHQSCEVLDRIINGSTNVQEVDNNFEFGCNVGGPSLLSTLLHSFPSQMEPILCTDLVVLDTLALKKGPFHNGYYSEVFRFLIEKNELNDFTIVLFEELWSFKEVQQALEIAIKNSRFNYNMAKGIYEYNKQNNYSYDIVLTIHFYTLELKKVEASKHTHTFKDTFDQSERDIDFWVDLLEKHQQWSDANVIISLYAGTNLINACLKYKRRIACIVQKDSQRTAMLNIHKSFQLSKSRSIKILENSENDDSEQQRNHQYSVDNVEKGLDMEIEGEEYIIPENDDKWPKKVRVNKSRIG